MLPIRPAPYPNEVWSSWITRVAVDNGHLPRVLVARLISSRIVRSNVDGDLGLIVEEIERLQEAVNVSHTTIRNSFLSTYEGVVAPTFDGQKPIPWIAETGRQQASAHGYAYCSACLAEDAVPHLRKQWRLAFHTICPRHWRVLGQRCPACGSAILLLRQLERRDAGDRPRLEVCRVCGFDLRRGPTGLGGGNDCPEFHALAALCATFEAGPIDFAGLRLPYPFQLFAGMRAIAGVLTSLRGVAMVKEIARRCDHDLSGLASGQTKTPLERAPVELRHQTMMATMWLLGRWPERFLTIAKSSGFTRWTFANERREQLPYWLASVIRLELDRGRYSPSPQETAFARRVAVELQGRCSKIAVKRLLGVTEGKAVDSVIKIPRRRATVLEVDQLFAHIAQLVTSMPRDRDRHRTLRRDFLMLLITAFSGLDIEDVCTLPRMGVKELHALLSPAVGTRSRKWQAVLVRGFEDYVRNVRPALAKDGLSDRLFVARFGASLAGHSLRERAARLVKGAGLAELWPSADVIRGVFTVTK